ncbi:hypothetical protein GCM10017706_06860 [Lactococcus lactis subsp. hordniae]|uniref:Uncharacterized protein n=1 Tax=Lactococcus lactis subsp. hordniae TaxID=203404 RepID=A0A5M9Q5V3_LACLH|nr:hypothetical protein F4V48_03285 [Lactococcus lactis subsp. hordniae]MCT3134293.1 hypothetical protein [Lactococcus lactis]
MKIIQAVHINGTDKHKRYWKVPDHLQPIRLRKGDEAAVETKSGPQRVKIVAVVTSYAIIKATKKGLIKLTLNQTCRYVLSNIFPKNFNFLDNWIYLLVYLNL